MIGTKLNRKDFILSTIAFIFVCLGIVPQILKIFGIPLFNTYIATLLFWVPFVGIVLSMYSLFAYRTKYSKISLCSCFIVFILLVMLILL